MKMRSWRVWLGSFWAHVEIMWCHCGHLGRTWGTWMAILEDLEQQEAKRGQQEAKRESKSENWWSKGGHRGTTRDDEGRQGFGSAAYGRQTGDIRHPMPCAWLGRAESSRRTPKASPYIPRLPPLRRRPKPSSPLGAPRCPSLLHQISLLASLLASCCPLLASCCTKSSKIALQVPQARPK